MRLVMQRKLGECGPACVAIVTGCSIDEVMWEMGDVSRGVTDERLVKCLMEFGVPAIQSLVWPDYSIPAILTVPSLNHSGLSHFIVWDGETYLDPTNGAKTYPKDSPAVDDEQLLPQWSSLILLWPKVL